MLLAARQDAKFGIEVCGANGEARTTTTLRIQRLRFAAQSGRLLCGTAGDAAHPGRAATVPRDEHGAASFTTAGRVRLFHGR